jgi:hypothetical protein
VGGVPPSRTRDRVESWIGDKLTYFV